MNVFRSRWSRFNTSRLAGFPEIDRTVIPLREKKAIWHGNEMSSPPEFEKKGSGQKRNSKRFFWVLARHPKFVPKRDQKKGKRAIIRELARIWLYPSLRLSHFKTTFTFGNADNGIEKVFANVIEGNTLQADQQLCVGSTCVTPAQFQAMVAAAGQPGEGSGSNVSGASATSTPEQLAAGNNQTPPVIQINGTNPAIINVGATYSDLGAAITGPSADLNLGITTYLNGVPMSPIAVDTSQPATDTIDYVATDGQGLTTTSTRSVIIEVATSTP